MGRRRSRRAKKDEAREQSRERRREQEERTRTAEPIKFDIGNGKTFEVANTTDARMLIRALNKGWIKDAFEIGPQVMLSILRDSTKSDRSRASSSRELRGYVAQILDAERDDQSPASNIQVNVGVNNTIQVAAIAERADDELEQFIHATAGVGGAGKAETNGHTLSNGVLSALANGKAVPVSTNGKH